jgi:hypothetical protein
MTDLEKLYLNYLDMTEGIEGYEPMTFDEYKTSREHLAGVLAEVDAELILRDAMEGLA